MRPALPRPLTLWRLLDGKPGHEKQSLGLANALARLVDCRCFDIATPSRPAGLMAWLRGRFPAGDALPAPDLILAAGHTTHFAALAARRARGGRIVMLMQPSLPTSWFDLCLVPEHDSPKPRANIINTLGVLNVVEPSERHDPGLGLILIGGASAHYRWDNQEVIRQVRAILDGTTQTRWQLSDSRRTPARFIDRLRAETAGANLEIRPHSTTPPGWLEDALAESGQVWVSEDSVSMVYEALTSGAPVGLIQLPRTRASRVSRGIDRLIGDNRLTAFDDWQRARGLPPPPGQFDEAGRGAQEILERWFPNAN